MSVTNLGIEGLDEVEQIGTGGSSRVYRALQADLDRVVAVKVIKSGHDPDVARRFDRERKAMGRLSNHEGIVPVYSSGVTSHGEPFLVMPYYPNGSLQDQIDVGSLDWQSAVQYVDTAAETIAAAHAEGIVHLDIKPANILLTNTGAPRIADFGIAKLASNSGSSARTTGTAFTPAYSAPETFLDGKASPAADVYGLGATLWALLVGHPPFLGPGEDSNLMAVIGRVVNNPLGDIRHLAPEPICRVVSQAMAKDPANRFQTAREFSLALKGAIAQSGAGAVAVSGAGVVSDSTAVHQFPPPVPYGNQSYGEQGYGDQQNQTQVFAAAPATAAVGAARTIDRGPASVSTAQQQFRQERPLLQQNAEPARYGPGPPPAIERSPLFDFDQFRFGPVLIGLVALLGVSLLAAWALTRDGGQTDAEVASGVSADSEQAPAGPETQQDGAAASLDLSSDVRSTVGAGGETSTTATTVATTSTPPTTASTATTATTVATTATTATTLATTATTPTTEATTSSTSTTEATTSTTDSTSSTSSSSTSSTTDPPLGLLPPTDVTAVLVDGNVQLSWSPPATGPQPTSYIVYRDGTLLAAAGASPFLDDAVGPGTHSYRVASVGENATQSDLSAAARIDVPAPEPLTLTVSVSNIRRTSITIRIRSNPCMDTIRISTVEDGSADPPTVEVLDMASCVTTDSHRISGLSPDTPYLISVTAIGSDGGTGSATPLRVSTD